MTASNHKTLPKNLQTGRFSPLRGVTGLASVAALALAGCIGFPGLTTHRSSGPGPEGGPPPAAHQPGPGHAHAPGAAPRGAAGAPASAPAASPAAVHTLSKSTANPLRLPRAQVYTTGRFRNLGLKNCGRASYISPQPVAVLNVTQPLSKVRITATGADTLVVMLPNRRYYCRYTHYIGQWPKVVAQLPAGRIKLYVAGRSKRRPLRYAIHVEDLERPVQVGWNTQRKLTFDAVPTEYKVLRFQTAASGPRKRAFASSYYYRSSPDVLIKLTRPLSGLRLRAVSMDDVTVELVGPMTPDGRRLRSRRSRSSKMSFQRLEAGLYGVRVLTRRNVQSTWVNLLVGSDKAGKTPLAMSLLPLGRRPLGARAVYFHYPQLNVNQLIRNDKLAAALYRSAPKALFVFPKYDMDATLAKPILKSRLSSRGSIWPANAGPEPAKAYPKKNEPVLLVANTWILTADGLVYRVRQRDLVAQPSGALQLPTQVRMPHCKYGPSVSSKAKEDQRRIKAYQRAVKRYGRCADRVWVPYGRRIRRLPYFYRSRIASIRADGNYRIRRVCGKKRLERKRNRLWAKLIKTRTRRRAKALQLARQHVNKLFQ